MTKPPSRCYAQDETGKARFSGVGYDKNSPAVPLLCANVIYYVSLQIVFVNWMHTDANYHTGSTILFFALLLPR
ncbi:hypothetical protein IQ07DRAFT_588534 [Pyrenochaeta sp. DS3sAY3a]|nr:hypothetical protein IQ07DRAFT_588534 [Pyrenochaeta sp. DS3sAY3a]